MPKQYNPKHYARPRPGTGYLHTRRDGTVLECAGLEWVIDFLDARGRRIRRKAHSGLCICPPRKRGACVHEQMAKSLLMESLSESSSSVEEIIVPEISLSEFLQEIRDELKASRRHSERSKGNIRKSISEFEKTCVARGVTDLHQVNRTLIVHFRDVLAQRRVKKTGKLWKTNTVNRYLRDLRATLNKAVRRGLLQENPARSTGSGDDLFLLVNDEKPITILTEDELGKLLSLTVTALAVLFPVNAQTILDMLLIFYHCGLRLGEVCNLTFAQIRNGVIQIEPHHEWAPKWGIRRSVPMTRAVREIIERRRASSTSEYVFATSNGTPFLERNVGDDFKTLFDGYGILGDTRTGVSTHCLRHTFCTTCLINNIPVTTVKDWMGHSKIEMTMRYYHKIPSKTDEMINQVAFVAA